MVGVFSPRFLRVRRRPARAAALYGLAGWLAAIPSVVAAEPLVIAVTEPDSGRIEPTDPNSDTAFGVGIAPLAMACEPAIAAAAAEHQVPGDLLLAIGMVESGLTPWVLNAEGTPYFFDDAASATAQLESLQAEGIASIDVGCMQVNLRWHPEAFATNEQALNPTTNADYAAQFLLGLYAMTGAWTDAVAYYHSSAQRYQRPYVCAVASRLEEMGSAMELNCEPSGDLDLPQVADSSTGTIVSPAAPAQSGPQHMMRIAPASGSAPSVVRGQDAPDDATDSAGPRTQSGPRIVRIP